MEISIEIGVVSSKRPSYKSRFSPSASASLAEPKMALARERGDFTGKTHENFNNKRGHLLDIYCILYTVYYILYIIYCILYTVYYILYIIYCILYTVYYILYIIYYKISMIIFVGSIGCQQP